jgi:hypothetical protein
MKRLILAINLLAGTALSVAPALAAYMPQDTPSVMNGVEVVCTGVGSAKNDPRWASYPVRLEFSNKGGQYVAGEHVLLNQNGKHIAALDCDAPWVLFKAPGGEYSVTSMLPSEPATVAHTVTFATSDTGRQKVVEVTFSRLPPNQ